MRILLVSNGFPPRGRWGTEFYTNELVRGLIGRGHDVSVLHPDRSGAEPRYRLVDADADGVVVHLLHNAGNPRKGFESSYADRDVDRVFRELLARLRPDVVHFTHLLWGLSLGMLGVCRELGVPSVVTLTDYGLLCHRGQMFDYRLQRCFGPHPAEVCARCIREPSRHDATPLRLAAKRIAVRSLSAVGGVGLVVGSKDVRRREEAVRRALAAADHLIAPTRVMADAFRGAGVPDRKLSVLVYSLDPTPYELARRAPAEGPVVFGYLGQFAPHKGFGTLLDAAGILERSPTASPWELRLHGAPAGRRHRLLGDRLLRQIRGPEVRILGPFEPAEAPAILAGLWAVVLPSEWDENAPLTALQARAAGVPVIASDVAGIREVIKDGRHGRLFPVGDARALAERMRAFVESGRPRTDEPGLPLDLREHLERIEEIHAAVRIGAK